MYEMHAMFCMNAHCYLMFEKNRVLKNLCVRR